MSKPVKRKRASQRGKIRGIYRRGNVFWFTRMERGQRIQLSLGTSDYSEAVVKAANVALHPFLNGSEPLAREIEEFLAHKKRQNEYSPASIESKQYALREFAKGAGQRSASKISTAEVERFYRSLQARVSESTAQGYIITIRSFFNRLLELKKVRVNPVADLRLARLDAKPRRRFCSRAERDTLIANAPNEAMQFILYCGFHAGLRKNEIIEARPEWFDLNGDLLHIGPSETFRPKDREARTIPLTKEFRRFLKHYGLRSPFMLRPDVKHGKSRYRWDFRRPWNDYMTEQGHPGVTPHIMRHTFASLLASAGRSIYKIAKWLGDDVRVVEKHYAKLHPKDDEIEIAF